MLVRTAGLAAIFACVLFPPRQYTDELRRDSRPTRGIIFVGETPVKQPVSLHMYLRRTAANDYWHLAKECAVLAVVTGILWLAANWRKLEVMPLTGSLGAYQLSVSVPSDRYRTPVLTVFAMLSAFVPDDTPVLQMFTSGGYLCIFMLLVALYGRDECLSRKCGAVAAYLAISSGLRLVVPAINRESWSADAVLAYIVLLFSPAVVGAGTMALLARIWTRKGVVSIIQPATNSS